MRSHWTKVQLLRSYKQNNINNKTHNPICTLYEVGLPQSAIPVALLVFNVGVELGQLLFIASILVIIATAVCPSWCMCPKASKCDTGCGAQRRKQK